MSAAFVVTVLVGLLLQLGHPLRLEVQDEAVTGKEFDEAVSEHHQQRLKIHQHHKASLGARNATAASEDDCAKAVEGGVRRNSAWRRWTNTCKCKDKGSWVNCPAPDTCPGIGRYYSPLFDKQGCKCEKKETCNAKCADVVPGSKERDSAWRRSEKCKCAKKDFIVQGEDEACRKVERKFKTDGLHDKGCACQDPRKAPAPVLDDEPTGSPPPPAATLPRTGGASVCTLSVTLAGLLVLMGTTSSV